MNLPRLENGVLFIGDSALTLRGCNLDTLLYYFGEPETMFYLSQDSRFHIYRFAHELGKIFAFVYFTREDYPVILETEGFSPDLDRGNLAELQIELDLSLDLRQIGKVRKRLANKGFKFVVFKGNVLGRMYCQREVNALSFLNPRLIKQPEQSFMHNLFFWLDSKPTLWLVREQLQQKFPQDQILKCSEN